VFRPVARVTSGLVIAPFLVFGSALAPLHAHEPGAGHSHALVHSHFEPHHLESHEPEGAEVEQGAARVIWLESAILHGTAYQIYPPLHSSPPASKRCRRMRSGQRRRSTTWRRFTGPLAAIRRSAVLPPSSPDLI